MSMAHFVYAREIVQTYHSKELAELAEKRYMEIAAGGIPQSMNTITFSKQEISIIELLRKAGFAQSNSDAKRLIAGGGIKINNQTVTDINLVISQGSEIVLSKGKNKFAKIIFTN